MASEVEIERLIVRLVGEGSSYQLMLKQAQQETRKVAAEIDAAMRKIEGMNSTLTTFGQKLLDASRGMLRMGRTLSLWVSTPLSLMGGAAVREFGRFDQAMTETFAKMGRQSPQIRMEMEQLAISMALAGKIKFNPTELAQGYEELAGAGLDAARAMKALPATATFAQAGEFGLNVAVEKLMGSMASFGKLSREPVEFAHNLERFSDVIVGVANETTASVEQVAQAMSADAAVAAKDYGMELETLGAILGVYALQNKSAEEAGHMTGRAIRLMTASFIKYSSEWKSLGIDIVDKTTGEFIHFTDAIGMLEQALQGLTGPQRVVALDMLGFETLAQKSILPLIGMSAELKRQEEIYRQHGTAIEMAGIQMEAFFNQIKPAQNAIKVLGIEIGTVLGPYIKYLGQGLLAAIEYFRTFDQSTKLLIISVGLFLAGIGPVVVYLGIFAFALGHASKLLATFGGTFWKLTTSPFTWFFKLSAILDAMPWTKAVVGTNAAAVANTTLAKSYVQTIYASGRAAQSYGVVVAAQTAYQQSTMRTIFLTQMATVNFVMLERGAASLALSTQFANTALTVYGQRALTAAGSTATATTALTRMGVINTTLVAPSLRVTAGASYVNAASFSFLTAITSRLAVVNRIAAVSFGFLKTAMMSAGRFLGMFKMELALVVAYLGWQLGSAIGNALFGVNDYNKAMEKSIALNAKLSGNRDNRNQNELTRLSSISDPMKKKGAIAAALDQATKNAQGFEGQMKAAEKRVAEFDTLWGKIDPYLLNVAKHELEEVTSNAQAAAEHVNQLKNLLTMEGGGAGGGGAPVSPAQAQLIADINQLTSSLITQRDTIGMTTNEAKIYELQMQGASEAQLKLARDIDSQIVAMEKQKDLLKDVATLQDELNVKIDTFGMSTSAVDIYKLKMQGATDAQLMMVTASQKMVDALEAQKKLMEDGADVMKKYAAPVDIVLARQKELNEMLKIGAIDRTTYNNAMKDAIDKAAKDLNPDAGKKAKKPVEFKPDLKNEQKQLLALQALRPGKTPEEEAVELLKRQVAASEKILEEQRKANPPSTRKPQGRGRVIPITK